MLEATKTPLVSAGFSYRICLSGVITDGAVMHFIADEGPSVPKKKKSFRGTSFENNPKSGLFKVVLVEYRVSL